MFFLELTWILGGGIPPSVVSELRNGRLRNRGSTPRWDRLIFPSLKRPDGIWISPDPQLNCHQKFLLGWQSSRNLERTTHLHLRLFVKNAWSYTSITSYVFILIHRYKCTFNIRTISLIFNSNCFFLPTHSNSVIFSRKLKSSSVTKGNVGTGCKLE
jgi:hypothetical protein